MIIDRIDSETSLIPPPPSLVTTMPPKGGKGSKKGKGKERTTAEDAEGVPIDSAELTSKMRVDKYIDQFYDRQEKADKAFLGFSKIDIIQRTLEFGKYNPRELDAKEKASLLDSFLANGLDRYGQGNVIHLIVNVDALILETVKKADEMGPIKRDGSHLPWLRFKKDAEEGISSTTITAAGGRHRRSALIDWIKGKKAALILAKRDLKELQDKQRDEPGVVPDEEAREAEALVQHLHGLVISGGSWIVAVYDESKSHLTDSEA